jgi:tryptophan synthase alpha chain
MTRYQQLFDRLNQQKEGAFVPFVTLGDPTPELSLQIIDTLIASGADALELGIPFSDPLADGPTIQNATLRAFNAGVTPTLCFDLISKIREKHSHVAIGLLVYANLVFSRGIDNFYQRCQNVGVDSVLVADVPLHEANDFRQAALKHGVAPIFICPPNASDELIRQIASDGQGYTYLLSRAGVTGTEIRAHKPLEHLIDKLNLYKAPPPIQGFGISEPVQVVESLLAGSKGVISGSAVVKIIERLHHEPDRMLAELARFVKEMKAATVK